VALDGSGLLAQSSPDEGSVSRWFARSKQGLLLASSAYCSQAAAQRASLLQTRQGELVNEVSYFAVELPGDSERALAAPSAVAAEREAASMFMAEVDRHNTAEQFMELPGTTNVVHKRTLVRQVLIRGKKSCDRTIRVQPKYSGGSSSRRGTQLQNQPLRSSVPMLCRGDLCCLGDLWFWWSCLRCHCSGDAADNSVRNGFRPAYGCSIHGWHDLCRRCFKPGAARAGRQPQSHCCCL
jgi:hypothetical protein